MKNTRPRRRRKAVLLSAAALALVLLGVAHSTEHPEVPYRVMPESSIVASDHLDVRGRWRDVVLLPAVSNALATADVDVLEFRDEPGWRILIPLTTGRNTVLAVTPEHGADGEPVLWGASFAGWRRLVLRFLLATRWIPGLGRLEIAPGGSRYLQLGSKRHPSDWKVGFAMRDNVLLAALSTDGDAVQALEKRADERAPLAAVFGGPDAEPWKGAGSKLHRFWVGGAFVQEAFGAPLEAWISEIAADAFSLGARLPRPDWLDDYLKKGERLTGENAKAAALGADSAFLLALLPRPAAARFLDELLYPGEAAPPPRLDREEDAVAYLTGGTFHGSLFGIRIPALTALCPGVVLDRDTVVRTVSRLTDGARYPAVLEGIDQKSRVLVPIRWQKGNALLKTYPEENGVVELNRVSHGFTFCSAQMSYDAQQKATPEAKAPWRGWLAPRLKGQTPEAPVGFLWIDIAQIADETRQILVLANFASRLGIVRFDETETAWINTAGSILGFCTMGGHVAILVSDDGHGFLHVEFASL